MHTSRWFHALIEPRSTDDDHRRREFILNVLLASSTILSIAALLIVAAQLFNTGAQYTGESPMLASLPLALFAGLWVLSRKGFFTPAAYVLIIILFALAAYCLLTWGILLPEGVLLLALVVEMASILLGTTIAAVVTVLAAAVLILLSWLQQPGGRVPFDASWMKTPGGPSDAITFALTLAVITTVSWLSNREIARFNVTLQERIRKATSSLSHANRNLKVLDKAKDDFISMASHQLGTPLTAITGYLDMALDDDKHNMTKSQREYIGFALEASERMVAMSADLLNVSRLNSGRFMIQRQSIDLAKLVNQEVDQLQPSAARKNLELTYDMPPQIPELQLDESKTRQVVMNFIDNAIYYTQTGSVHVALKKAENQVVFTVTDTGIGVPKAEQSKLFAKFYRAGNARVVRPDGTGLGLYLAKKVIEEQGGAIIFTTQEGKGSTFGFSLPL